MDDPPQNRCTIAVFARAPVAGQCKTRLIPRLGPQGAADLQARLIVHAIETARAANCGPVELWCSPDTAHKHFADCGRRFDVALRNQQGEDLGARMHFVFAQANAPVLLMGTDSPSITPEDIKTCAAALCDGCDAVFLPAEDGGYGLVGLNAAIAEIFANMTWSTDHVMSETRQRLQRAGRTWRGIRTVWDVDQPADYDRLLRSGLIASLMR